MFHVLTVHFRSQNWIDVQLRYVQEHLPPDTQVWGCLNGIDSEHWHRFDHAVDFQGSHAEKLNELARMVSETSDADDYLVFLDGDAFPISRIDEGVLAGAPLAAVRRDENLRDPQPHPCFCVTSVGFWNEIKGDWRPGYRWKNELGYSVTDVGGILLRALRRARQPWTPLLRSNTVNLHPVFYGVYGGVVYHHGAGFREKHSRSDLGIRRARVPSWLPVLRDWERKRVFPRAVQERRDSEEGERQQALLSQEIYQSILHDENFYRRFIS